MQKKPQTTQTLWSSDYNKRPMDFLAVDIAAWAISKGFWNSSVMEGTPGEEVDYAAIRNFIKSTKLMLVVTELAECVEHLRKPAPSAIEGFSNEEEEIADAIIRLLDYCGYYGLRIGAAVEAKMAHNEGRPYQHDKAF